MKAEHIQYNEQKNEINKHIMKTEEFVKEFKIENISKNQLKIKVRVTYCDPLFIMGCIHDKDTMLVSI